MQPMRVVEGFGSGDWDRTSMFLLMKKAVFPTHPRHQIWSPREEIIYYTSANVRADQIPFPLMRRIFELQLWSYLLSVIKRLFIQFLFCVCFYEAFFNLPHFDIGNYR